MDSTNSGRPTYRLEWSPPYEQGDGYCLAETLRKLADRIENGFDEDELVIRDDNGNRMGTLQVIGEYDPQNPNSGV